jgi:uncharacterized repeat protein (TIGR01451 family)
VSDGFASAEMGVSLSGRSAPLLVDPNGARCGVRDITQESYEEVAGCTIVRGSKGGGIRVLDPSDGTYTVQLSGDAAEDVALTVSYLTGNAAVERRFDLFYPGSAVAFTFVVDAGGEPPLQLASQPRQPEDLSAMAVGAGDGRQTELRWTAVTDPSLAGYRIYSRRDDEPSLALLAGTASGITSYQTGHPWDEPRRIYAVSAVTASGKESFLSNHVENQAITVADFSGSPVVGEAPLSVQFQDLSTGEVVSWEWDFGDGSVGSEAHPTHTYLAAGAYTVRLTVVGEEGGDTRIREAYVSVYEHPSAAFSATPMSGSAPLAVQFTDASTGSVTGWLWDFGDGTTSTDRNPSHTYVTAGSYNVSLTATGPTGSDAETNNGYIEVLAGADISVTKADAPDPVPVGADLTYTLQVANGGPGKATGVVLTDTLPNGPVFVSAVAGQGGCTRVARKVTCNLGDVNPGGSVGVQVVVRPQKTGTLTNTAAATANESDPNPANNSATTTTTVKNLPTMTIVANDPQASEAGRERGQFTIYRTGGTSKALEVNYSVSGTATNGVDYAALSGHRTIPAGASNATIIVTPINDKFFEGDETVVVTLSADAAYVLGNPCSASVTIADNDMPTVTIKATDKVASESGGNKGKLTITRNGDSSQPLTVNYTVSGTATNGPDYAMLPGTITIDAGLASVVIMVSPVNDMVPEGSETVSLTLAAGSGYQIGVPDSATVTILDND